MASLTTKQLEDPQDPKLERGLEGRLQEGTLVQGRYRIMNLLASGGFSLVYRARDMHFPHVTRLCAVKEMVRLDNNEQARELATSSFEREAGILATLDHPAVPEVYDYFTIEDRGYLVLEYIRGKDLEALANETPGFFATEQVLDWAIQICDVLAYLHDHKPQPVIFRDVKPSNIMLDPYGRIRLIDFNIAKVFQAGAKGTMIGTEGYSPPEQYRGESSPAVDIYSLGATLHHLLTKRDPRNEAPFSFDARPINEINPDVSPELVAIVDNCLAYDVQMRYKNAIELREALTTLAKRFWTTPLTQGTLQAHQKNVHASDSRNRRVQSVVPLWEFECEDEVRSTPAIDRGMLYVGAYDNNLYAITTEGGQFRWKYAATDGIASSPYVYKDSVFIGSSDSFLYSLHPGSGRLNWRFETGGAVHSSPRADYGHVFFGSDDGYLYAVNVSNGRQVWRANAHGMVRSSPQVSEELIYFGTQVGLVYCVNLSGQIKWQFQARRSVTSSPALAEELIYVGSMDGTVYAIDANSGWAIWRFRTNRPIVSTPVVHDSIVYIGSSDGNLYALDAFSGRKVWQFATDAQINSSPAIWKDSVYFGATDGNIYSLNIKQGKLQWQFQTGGVVVSSPKAVNGVIYVGSCDHHVYALPA